MTTRPSGIDDAHFGGHCYSCLLACVAGIPTHSTIHMLTHVVLLCVHACVQAQALAVALGGPLLLSKGQVDVITDGQQSLVVTADGSPRRCGGQGDVLTGGDSGVVVGGQQRQLVLVVHAHMHARVGACWPYRR
jgi:hypothetical protein